MGLQVKCKPTISFINMAAFQYACRAKGARSFQLQLDLLALAGQAAKISGEGPDLSNVLKEYW